MSEEESWYFIIYEQEYISKTTGHSQGWTKCETITQQHPIDFLVENREQYSENENTIFHYRLVFWAEIPEDVAVRNVRCFE